LSRARATVVFAVDAHLRINDPWGRAFDVEVRGGQGKITVPRAAIGYTTLRSLPRSSDRERWIRQVQRALVAGGITIDVMCEGRSVARLAPESRGNWLGGLLRLRPVEVRLGAVIAALVFPRTGRSAPPRSDG
jgi:hypothetical protein